MRRLTLPFLAVCLATVAYSQQTPLAPPAQPPQATQQLDLRSTGTYILGPGDQIQIRAFEVEEINDKPFLVDQDGTVNLPLVDKIKAADLTVREFEAALTVALKKYVKEPQVIVTIVQFRSEPVFFVGAFAQPGIFALQGRRQLVEMLASKGGLAANASHRIKVTRRFSSGLIPLPNAVVVPEAKISYVEISMGSLRENVNPAEDIVLKPFDTISVERAEMIFVQGEVSHAGGFEVGERESLSVLQVLTMAGGVNREAAVKKVRVLRPVLNTSRRAEIPLNVMDILAGKATDFPLLPNDILYVPRNKTLGRAYTVIGQYILLPLIPTLIYAISR